MKIRRIFLTVSLAVLIQTALYAQWTTTSGVAHLLTASNNVGIGTATTSGNKLYVLGNSWFQGTASFTGLLTAPGGIRGSAVDGSVRISTPTGYLDLGSMNAAWAHFATDRPSFYFNKPVTVNGGISSYDINNLNLQTNGVTRLVLENSTGYVYVTGSSPGGNISFYVNGGAKFGGNATIGRSGNQYDEFGYNVGFTPTSDQYKYLITDASASIRMGRYGDIEFRTAPSGTAGAALTLTQRMVLKENGNLLIGKTTQVNNVYKLDVNGSIRANEVVVNTTGADFVFNDEYKLRPIEEVSQYVKFNKHLPEVEPANCMEENGVEIGTLQIKLLQKIEELTLYLIDQNEKLKKQQLKIDALEKLLLENKAVVK
jgi:hypothetical protein